MWLLPCAYADPGLALPPTETPAVWTSAAALAGLRLGCEGVEPCVRVEVGRDWVLVVEDRRAHVPVPTDEPGRAAVAFVAASLARPLPAPSRPDTPGASPDTTGADPASETNAAGAPGTTPADAATAPTAADAATASTPSPLRLALLLTGGGFAETRVSPALAGSVAARVTVHALVLDAGVAVAAPAPLPYDPTWTQLRVDLFGELGVSPAPWLGLGLGGGASWRAWADTGVQVGAAWVPYAELLVEARAPGRVLDVVVRGGPSLDLRGVTVARDGVALGTLGPWGGSLQTGILLHPR